MSNRYSIDLDLLQSIADAIRVKTGETGLIAVKDFPEKIIGIITGTLNEITSEIDVSGNITTHGLVSMYDNDNSNVSIYGFNTFVYDNGNVIIK